MEESHSISFENTPFSVEDEKIFDCQHGHHYYTKKEFWLRKAFNFFKKVY